MGMFHTVSVQIGSRVTPLPNVPSYVFFLQFFSCNVVWQSRQNLEKFAIALASSAKFCHVFSYHGFVRIATKQTKHTYHRPFNCPDAKTFIKN